MKIYLFIYLLICMGSKSLQTSENNNITKMEQNIEDDFISINLTPEEQKGEVLNSNEENNIQNLSISRHEQKTFVGNYQEYQMRHNHYDLKIIGNYNTVKIHHNYGVLRVIGNFITVKVDKNDADIYYIGNGGHITLGRKSKIKFVHYIGNDATIIIEK